jgi:hypothetical protein
VTYRSHAAASPVIRIPVVVGAVVAVIIALTTAVIVSVPCRRRDNNV